MKKILIAVILAGLSGAAYAGTASEQLGLNKEGAAVGIPAVSAAASVPYEKFTPPASKLAALKKMFETGTKMSYQQLNYMLTKDTGGAMAGNFVSNVLGSREETEGIEIKSTLHNDGGAGPLWPAKPTGYYFRIAISRSKPYDLVIYCGDVPAQPSDEVKTISVKNLPMFADQPAGNLDVEMRRNGQFVVGHLSGNAVMSENSRTGSYSGDAYFYIWQR